jgi:hypothetical protein
MARTFPARRSIRAGGAAAVLLASTATAAALPTTTPSHPAASHRAVATSVIGGHVNRIRVANSPPARADTPRPRMISRTYRPRPRMISRTYRPRPRMI